MERKEKEKEVSGWYVQKEQTAEEAAAQMRAVESWYQKKQQFNYRTVPLEIPGKMMLALGRIAAKEGVSFSEFIEEILQRYLRQKKINWKTLK